ncbi:TVP38/TMEM64 family protein [Roseococcus microcysteis]|uniref:TVP38/TMEM64 family protein n=1 Tax=Roseococcus microcysteis TaxID=2771361 RepID=UPI00168C0C45|nr:VTT domain-containing protein [Roseococcus microcysteis]
MLRDRRLWLALAAVALVLALRFTGLGDFLSLETLARHRATLSGFVAGNAVLAGLVYVAVYAAAVALSVPGAVILTLAGGFLFGAFWGTALAVVGATLGATGVFLFAGLLFGEKALDRFGAPARRLAEAIRRNAASYLLVLRLVPLFPFFLVNLVPAFVGVRLPVYVVTTFLGIIPGTAVFSLTGAGLGNILDAGGTLDLRSVLSPEILAGLLGLAALSLAAIPLRKRLAAR